MWTREELKQNAKNTLRDKYWTILGVSVLASILQGSFFTIITEMVNPTHTYLTVLGNYAIDVNGLIRLWIIITIISWLYSMFLGHTILIGAYKYFILFIKENPSTSTLFDFFKTSYWNIVKVTFFYQIKIVLWTLCFIVPGIIKAYEYCMVPYILAEHPEMESAAVFERSRMLTQNNKLNIFVLEISFIGWLFLGMLCCGIGILFVSPYIDITMTHLYLKLKEIHGIDQPELPPIPEIL
ncbi:DUF975 family protein [Faecalicoccus pleomorphus]|uniref:DUF975 family protein n=1 Tax=Faecalicoccus pleomorphus TaxID=1323 RepID=UPI001960B7E0|nr:DUF975 family protein [Faecalicoccus pleomorphus]MBM6807850.1 DUF975 family protein [Faecalicoccus pleomorphus]